ncbi:MAG: hypothetical protein ABIJ41_03885 [Candidatus Omnitrophota bacterium]
MIIHRRKNNKAQIFTEYAAVVALVAAVAITMSVLVKRTIQARMRDAHEWTFQELETVHAQSGAAGNFVHMYEPYYRDTTQKLTRDYSEKNIFEGWFVGTREINERTEINSESIQASPREAD